MKKAYIYIGSNNDTHVLEREKIEQIISEVFEGFTLYEVIGYWKGAQEKTAKVEIAIQENQEIEVIRLCKQLRIALSQDAIMLELVDSNIAFIQ